MNTNTNTNSTIGVMATCGVALATIATYKFFFHKQYSSSSSVSCVRGRQQDADVSYVLGRAENALARYAMERQGDMKIGVVLRLSPMDDLTCEQFGDAVATLQRRHPLLRLVLSTKSK